MARPVRLMNVNPGRVVYTEGVKRYPPAWTDPVVAQVVALQNEADRLKALNLPAAFGGKPVPDTPEAAAARRQMDLIKGLEVHGNV